MSVKSASMSALRNLFNQLIDYAGLFPPASLELPQVVANYARYLEEDWQWMLARLIVPALKLRELELLTTQLPRTNKSWLISALLPPVSDPDFARGLAEIRSFNERGRGGDHNYLVDTIEVSTPSVEHLEVLVSHIPSDISVFAELPWRDHQPHFEQIARIREKGRSDFFAKIRTGGVQTDLIPSADVVSNFIWEAKSHAVGFKATAGLHHPIRSEYRLTYADESPIGLMHGFLNVFVAACLVDQHKIDRELTTELLLDSHADHFEINQEFVGWRNYQLDSPAVRHARREFCISFGSCSFTEPIEDLQHINIL
ncbi:MAG TPA: hypothetical protein PKD64_03825 [Pirellulaceae bacterium]|nr:hypothetical protein [Pirellulaceae bacterium]HMO91300.1 hypothetical protein [Pirellulaceae bacterium]HMP68516.1 hypothetical protein [Pirellulaceae bacterium]